jgi:hypothetical protein
MLSNYPGNLIIRRGVGLGMECFPREWWRILILSWRTEENPVASIVRNTENHVSQGLTVENRDASLGRKVENHLFPQGKCLWS